MPFAFIALMAALAGEDPAPARLPPKQVSPVTVNPVPTDGAKPQVQVVGGDFDFIASQDISIWPAAALARRANGKVTLRCWVDVHGIAERCSIAAEDPRGLGFGKAALALKTTLKLRPNVDASGQPIDSEMLIALNFKAPEADGNLGDVLRAAHDAPLEGQMTGAAAVSMHEINGSALRLYHNPIPTRSVTLMTDPVWVQAPDFDAFSRAYPAEGGGLEGWAVAHCKVDQAGVLSRCVVAKEEPVRHGFGAAAVALAAQFRISPQAMAEAPHGAPVEVDVPVRFPATADAKNHTVYSPLWSEPFDPVTAARYYPPEAQAKGVREGEAVVSCHVVAGGALSGCEVERARPDGMGFDDAALKVAQTMRMTLWSGEASPVVGGVVHLPIKLEAPGGN
jgi:TonB family protein